MGKNFNFLQLSDLHIKASTDWNCMLKAYETLSQHIKPDFIVVTGDFKHKKFNNSYNDSLDFLNEITKIFKLKKSNIFLVPGNHDADDFEFRTEIISNIRANIENDADIYSQYVNETKSAKNLSNGFKNYIDFVREFYGSSVKDDRTKNPTDIMCINWEKTLNVVILNTALISDGNSDKKQIVDIKKLSSIKTNPKLPTIVLAHHDINSLIDCHKRRVCNILNNLDTKAYLCGDKHLIEKDSVDRYNEPNTTFPCIVCGKSAIEMGDDYSELGVISYTCKNDGNVYVQVYEYEEGSFITSNKFYYNINKPYYFKLFNNDDNASDDVVDNNNSRSSKKQSKNASIWLPDAELAKGKQTRFNSFTNTPSISKFFERNSPFLGIASVKGIGKTFLLQVKRVNSSKKYYCLPKCSCPSVKNNWATERISISTYSKLKTDNIYDNLVNLWIIAFEIYVINHFSTLSEEKENVAENQAALENQKTIEEYFNKNKLSSDIMSLCIDKNYSSLNSIIKNILCIDNWSHEISKYDINIANICNIVLQRRKASTKQSTKEIAIFVDKIDQAIKQTNAEPPADCVLCKLKNGYSECRIKDKGTDFCFSDDGCKEKLCCYGCEIFAGNKSNEGLRIHENSNVANLVHINIWQYFQLALMSAAGQLCDDFGGQINVFYTIRLEAFNCEDDRLGEQNQKLASKLLKLSYSFKEQERIFLDCIKEQDDSYLFSPEHKHTKGKEAFAFVGLENLCHPYCKDKNGNNQKETIFSSIYRHSFDRTRDIQRYGEEITKNIDTIREFNEPHKREEFVKQLIEDLAADLAYCSDPAINSVNLSYYTEKKHYLPNYWADKDNFEYLLSLIDRNLLFEDDIKRICKKINSIDECPEDGCISGKCKRHPFSMLYNMGYLGYILKNSNNSNQEVMNFKDSSQISYFYEKDTLITADRAAYIIHPALTKAIEKNYNKSLMHFSGFILGKGRTVDKEILSKIIEDKKNLDAEVFKSKYYFKP